METKTKFTPSFAEEKLFWDKGISHVIGIDEVGRGCFAGPVVTAGVVFHPDYFLQFENNLSDMFSWLGEIHDSKLLKRATREKLSPLIQKHCLFFSIVTIPVPTINKIGIGKATFVGMRKVVKNLLQKTKSSEMAILVDAFVIPRVRLSQKALIKGDQKSISIAAASIIAKVYRDNLMTELANIYSGYYFEKNMGYGTKAHRAAMKRNGLSAIHRTSFDLQKHVSLS